MINRIKKNFYLLWLKKPSSASVFDISKISEITPPLLLINWFLTYAVWFEEIRKALILVERTSFLWLLTNLGKGGCKKYPLPKIYHTYPTMMKLGSYSLPKDNPKNIWITWYISWVLLTSAYFHRKSANFAISENTYANCILVHNLFLIHLTFLSL